MKNGARAARLALLVALAAGAAFGQLQLFTFDGVRETAAPALFDAGSAAAGDSLEIRFRVRNQGTSSASLTILSVAGAGFALTARPTLPYALIPGAFVEFRVGFSLPGVGTSSAVVTANSASTMVRATSIVVAEVAQVISGTRVVVPNGATIDLGRIERGQSSAQQMFLHNPGSSPLQVALLSTTGEGFSSTFGPFTLPAGAWQEFAVSFFPTRTGDFTGSLKVDQRTFVLRGLGFDPPLPRPSVFIDSGQVKSGEQHQVSLRFGAPSPVSGAGTLQMFFDSAISTASGDPAVQFVKTSTRSASFTVVAGESQARFGTDSSAVFQTGTTAGALRFQISITGQGVANDLVLPVAPAPILLDTISPTRRIDALDLKLSGFDNTYSAGSATFTFFDSAGRAIDPGAIKADFTSDFKTYFASSGVGSAFQMRVSFPVSGDSSQVASVEAELINAVGATRTQRIAFP